MPDRLLIATLGDRNCSTRSGPFDRHEGVMSEQKTRGRQQKKPAGRKVFPRGRAPRRLCSPLLRRV